MFLTLGVTVVTLVIAAVQYSFEVWAISAALWFMIVVAVWIGTLTVGCLVMIPVGIWRLSKRLARGGLGETIPQGRVWDRWMDGSEPMRLPVNRKALIPVWIHPPNDVRSSLTG